MKPDNYLDIAEAVLRTARRPLSARAIMNAAHRGGIVPSHLFGKTQHKTLHARLSEDILQSKLESRFFRTNPGLFFLSALRSDPTIPDDYKDPFHARRRTRDLHSSMALAFDRDFLRSEGLNDLTWEELIIAADHVGAVKHIYPKPRDDKFVLVWAFSVVRRKDEILSYRIGRYRDNRDCFANHKSIGFTAPVTFDDQTLFSTDMGVSNCGLSAVMSDLDLSNSAAPNELLKPSISFAVVSFHSTAEPVVLFVMEWECPAWFEPTARRLSLNEVRWIDATRQPNDIQSFEPWSAIAFEALVDRAPQMKLNAAENKRATASVLSI